MNYAYLLFSSNCNKKILKDLKENYFGDIIEVFSEVEDQATEIEDIWGFDWWKKDMSRLSVVQVIEDWNPLNFIINIIKKTNIDVFFENENIIVIENKILNKYFNEQIIKINVVQDLQNPKNIKDKDRFIDILISTINLALKENRGLVLISGKGWYYNMEVPENNHQYLKDNNIIFYTRHS